MTDVFVGSGDSAPSDAELILEVRGGDLEAYGALYARHAAAARTLARQYVRVAADAEDIVAEAFDRVLRVLQHGGGPDLTFRAYLFTVVRRLAADVARGARRTRPTDDDGTFEAALGRQVSSDDAALAGFDRTIVALAYRSLPERWQAVLWYTEIENLAPAEIAPILGLTPNGVSALAYRAREGLRVGYLQQHLRQDPDDACRVVNPLLGAYVRGGLARREATKVDDHLQTCGGCRTLVLELTDVAHGMRTVVAPLVLGIAGMAALGSLPLGGATAGAIAGAASAAGGTGTGAAAAAVGTTAGTTASAGAATSAGTGAVAMTSAAGGAGTAATGIQSLLATGAAGVATGAGAATGVTGGSVAVAAGALAVAAVGVVTGLNALEPHDPPPPERTVAETWEDRFGQSLGDDGDAGDDATSPASLSPAAFPEISAPPELVLAAVDPQVVLEARVPAPLPVTVSNHGGRAAEGTLVQLDLPEGLRLASPVSPHGAAAGAGDLTAETLACTPGAAVEHRVLCTVGTLEPGETRTVAVPVVARHGGTYTIPARVWADGPDASTTTTVSATVAMYGPELTAARHDPVVVENPGEASIPVEVTNTGDTAASDWSVDVVIPAGLSPVAADGDLVCEPAEDRWTCRPDATTALLAPGEVRSARIHVVADGEAPAGTTTVALQPLLRASDHVVPAVASVEVAEPWQSVAGGAGTLEATCRATGGVDEADAVVRGTYLNTSSSTVTVRLHAAGSAATQDATLAPGASTTSDVHDGIRVPAGDATWYVTAFVAGTPYSTTVPAGPHGAQDCYEPAWDVTTTVETVNVGGTVGVEGTITNRTAETMQVGMLAAGRTATPVHLGAGETATLSVDTGETSYDGGDAAFTLYRWVTDHDGDQPESGVVAPDAPTARFDGAALGPRVERDPVAAVGDCRYDAAAEVSYRTFQIGLDNTRSTLPVTFTVTVDGVERRRTVEGGVAGHVAVNVPWGTGSLEVLADGRSVGTVDVGFESCASDAWPRTVDVSVTAQCVDDHVHVLADVRNGGASAAVANLVLGGRSGPSATVAPGTTQQVSYDLGVIAASSGKATVRLDRTVEGARLVHERDVRYPSESCVRVAPAAHLDLGRVTVDAGPGGATSRREVGVVLDNSDSNVPVEFRLLGPGVDRTVEVGAGARRTVPAGTVEGRHGATFRAIAGGEHVDLAVERFTGAPAWCAAPPSPGRAVAPGTVASWRGENYRALARGGSSEQLAAAVAHRFRQGTAAGQVTGGWERISSCEYR